MALDATSLGDGFTVLSIGVVYRGQAIPVAWKVLHANVPTPGDRSGSPCSGSSPAWSPPGHTVIVMTDCALYARWLYQEIVSLRWHPVMRITKLSKFRKGRSKTGIPVTALVPRVGCRWQGRGVAFPKKPERRLECTLMACWEESYEEPWFLVTDLAADQAEGLWYGMRSWIEVCQAECVSRDTLYRPRGAAHRECRGAVGAGTMEPAALRSNQGGPPCDATSSDPVPPARTIRLALSA